MRPHDRANDLFIVSATQSICSTMPHL